MRCFTKHKQQSKAYKSQVIQEELKLVRKELESQVKILLLGTGDAGKSTFLKQLKWIHNDGFSNKEINRFREILQDNLLTSIQQFIINDHVNIPKHMLRHKRIILKAITPYDCVDSIISLWAEPTIKRAFENRILLNILVPSTAEYFFTHAARIADHNFLPTPEDIFRAKIKTTGITECKFWIDDVNISVIDVGGQRSERRKWIHLFDDVTSIIYLVAIDEYDMKLEEDNETNRLEESLRLFSEMSSSVHLRKASWILFLNKNDIFQDKIEKYPLSHYFKDCKAKNYEQSFEYIKTKFVSKFQGSHLYVYATCALDSINCKRVFSVIKNTILTLTLEDSELLM